MRSRDQLYAPLDKQSTVPLHLQLKHHLVYLVGSGELPPGSPLPSVRQLAQRLGVATVTVQRAYADLQVQGILASQAGRGVFVADLAASLPRPSAERSDILRAVLLRAVAQARGLGFREQEILGAAEDFLRLDRPGPDAPRVVFVGNAPEFADKYRRLLSDALSGAPCLVESVTVADLQDDPDGTLDPFEPISYLVCVVSTLPEVRRLAAGRGVPVYPLVVDLADETQEALIQLPYGEPIGLVAENHLMASRRALIQHYRGTDDDLRLASARDPAAVDRLLAECRVVVHSLESRALLAARDLTGHELLELRYRPNAASLARLRSLLGSAAPAAHDRSALLPA